MSIIDIYVNKSMDLAISEKTGLECEYCRNEKTNKNDYGVFCAGCGHEVKQALCFFFGVPVYDRNDYIEILKNADFAILNLKEVK